MWFYTIVQEFKITWLKFYILYWLFFAQFRWWKPFQSKPQQNCFVSPSNTAVFRFWMNPRFFERIESMIQYPIHKDRLCSKCHTIILLLLFLQHAVCMLRIVCKFSVCMEYPDDLLFLPESAKYNSSTLKSVQKLCSEWHTIIQLLLYCSMLCVYCE